MGNGLMRSLPEAYAEAETYFAGLWARAQEQWRVGQVMPARMQHGATVPVDYCVSSVAFLEAQNAGAQADVARARHELQRIAPEQFFYLPESTHITLLGCTQRHPAPDAFSTAQLDRIAVLCADALRGQPPVMMHLKGLGALGNQVFVQVYPLDRRWEALRTRLGDLLVGAGEAPMLHPNKAPIHMNLMRITDASPGALTRVIEAVGRWRDVDLGSVEVAVVDLVITDFVISPPHTRHCQTYRLG
jgi:2'-5' RNA ligase